MTKGSSNDSNIRGDGGRGTKIRKVLILVDVFCSIRIHTLFFQYLVFFSQLVNIALMIVVLASHLADVFGGLLQNLSSSKRKKRLQISHTKVGRFFDLGALHNQKVIKGDDQKVTYLDA